MEMTTTNSSHQDIVTKNATCNTKYFLPSFINKTEFCRQPVYFQCPVYPCFLDGIELTLSALGFILNLSTTIALLRLGRNLKPRHRLLASLSITDMAISCFHVIRLFYNFPSVFANRHRYVPISYAFGLSVAIGHAYTYIQFSAIMNILLIAIDVFLAVSFPLFHRSVMTKSRAAMLVGLAWTLSLVIYVSTILSTYPIFKQTPIYIAYNILSLVCIVALCILYVILLWKVHTLKRSENRRTLKATGTVFAILMTFTVFMLPGFWLSAVLTRRLVRPGVFTWNLWFTTIKMFQCLCVLNAVCDPIIYILRMKEIRDSFKTMWYHCCKHRLRCIVVRNSDPPSSSRDQSQ